MSIIVYTFEDAQGRETGSFSTQSASAAKEHAQEYGYNVKANEYEFSDSYPVEEWQFARGDED